MAVRNKARDMGKAMDRAKNYELDMKQLRYDIYITQSDLLEHIHRIYLRLERLERFCNRLTESILLICTFGAWTGAILGWIGYPPMGTVFTGLAIFASYYLARWLRYRRR